MNLTHQHNIEAFVILARKLGIEYGGLLKAMELLDKLNQDDKDYAENFYFDLAKEQA